MAVAKVEEAVRKNKGEADVQLNLANAYLVSRQTEQASAWKVLELSPFRQEAYEMLRQIHLSAARLTLEMGNKERAGEILREALKIPDLINRQVAGLNEFETSAFKGTMLTVRENMKNGLA